MKCPYCQMEISDGTRICPQCKKDNPPCAEISDMNEEIPKPQSKDNEEVGIVTCVIAFALFFGGCGGLWVGLGGAVLGLIIGLLFCRKRKHGADNTIKGDFYIKKIMFIIIKIIVILAIVLCFVLALFYFDTNRL